MIIDTYDAEHNAVVVELEGDVDAAQARRAFSDLEKLLPECKGGFTLLVDYSAVETMEPEVKGEILKAMDLVNARGVREIIRVLPDPGLDLGFSLISALHYSKDVQIHTARSSAEALALLRVHG